MPSSKTTASQVATPGDKLLEVLSEDDSIQNALNRMVVYLAGQWEAHWCVLYLYNESTGKLTLQAIHGNPSVRTGEHSMVLGEGLAGAALAQRSPFYTEKASAEPNYKRDERFLIEEAETALAIPILRGEERISVLVLHRPTGVGFSAEEISALRTTASQVAGFLENARALLLIAARTQRGGDGLVEIEEQRLYRGTPVTSGIAIGESRVLARARAAQTLDACRRRSVPWKARRTLEEAVELSARQLLHDQKVLGERLPEAAAMFFEAHLLMLKDDVFIGKIRERIAEGQEPIQAIAGTAIEFVSFFEASTHDYLREKARDVEDLAMRLIRNIRSEPSAADETEAPCVLVTAELLPSDILKIARGSAQGIVLVGGGSTAHVTLLVRSLRIPMVITQAEELLRIRDGIPAIVDCATGNIILRPKDTIYATYLERQREIELRRDPKTSERTHTRDGTRVHLLANVNLLVELELANAMKAEGIGLYRSEFPFLMRQALPTEDEQFAVYDYVLEHMQGKPVVFRTLDAGGDKVLLYFDQAREENPALGLRSVRFTLRYPFVFDQQLRAMLRAIEKHQYHEAKVMFPMIGSVEELKAATERVDVCLEQLRHMSPELSFIRPEIGTMVELPALVHLADAIAREASFLSIGTNDFIQYMLAADRTNAEVAQYYLPHHPAVLHGLRHIVRAALAVGRQISVCGEMGRDLRYIPFFLGIGLRNFSIEPGFLGKTHRAIEQLTIAESEEYANRLLGTNNMAEIKEEAEKMQRHLTGVKLEPRNARKP